MNITYFQTFIGFSDILHIDHCNIYTSIVFCTEVQHFLRSAIPPIFEPEKLRRRLITLNAPMLLSESILFSTSHVNILADKLTTAA